MANKDYTSRLQELGCRPPSKQAKTDVQALEATLGVSLPTSYRDFLATCGGWWGDVLCSCQEPTPFGVDHWMSVFHDVGQVQCLLDSVITPRNMITIASGHLSKFTCLSIAGIDHGHVYALDGEFRADWNDEEFNQRFDNMAESIQQYLEIRRLSALPPKPVGYENLYLVARDFETFLALCRPEVID